MTPGTATRALILGILAFGMHAAQVTAASGEAGDPVPALLAPDFTGIALRRFQPQDVDAPSSPRVHSQSARVGAAIARGTERSPTFRRLVETINATNGGVRR
jgi:hypothetical protein